MTPKSKRPTKPDLGNGVSHPARYSDALIPVLAQVLADHLDGPALILDPFAGTGKIHLLQDHGHDTIGVELEPEWANLHPDTIVGNALCLPFAADAFDAVVTSPVYGNRLSDHHDARDGSVRRSYTHDLGRTLHPDNAGAMQWGDAYRDFHRAAWCEAVRVVRPDGLLVVNVKDFYRNGQWQDAAAWHAATLVDLGLHPVAVRPVATPSLRAGANRERRVGAELVMAFRIPT